MAQLLHEKISNHTSNFLKIHADCEKSKVITRGCLNCRDEYSGKNLKKLHSKETWKFKSVHSSYRDVKSRNQTLTQLNVSGEILNLSDSGHQNFSSFLISFRNKFLKVWSFLSQTYVWNQYGHFPFHAKGDKHSLLWCLNVLFPKRSTTWIFQYIAIVTLALICSQCEPIFLIFISWRVLLGFWSLPLWNSFNTHSSFHALIKIL